MKTCVGCGAEIVFRAGERPGKFRKKRYCRRGCSNRGRIHRHPSGPGAPGWKGDGASDASKRLRAQRTFSLPERCERCSDGAVERHHKDGDPGNNERSNIEFLCRRCHMTVDGRLDAFVAAGEAQRRKRGSEIECSNCGCTAPTGRHWKGRCHTCDMFLRTRGIERPQRLIERVRQKIHARNAA